MQSDRRTKQRRGWHLSHLNHCAISWLSHALAALIFVPVVALAVPQNLDIAVTIGEEFPFTPLHLYYISPTGNDGANGQTPATAWRTPRHNVVCGDVIIVQAGNYGGWSLGSWGTVSNCPSTSGGIDGTGGIYFAVVLCAGPNMMSCQFNSGGRSSIRIDKAHWAVSGLWASQNPDGDVACFLGDNQTHPTMQFIAFINVVASTCNLAGFSTGGGGAGADSSFDHIALVGAVSFNGANSWTNRSFCGSGVSLFPGNPDNSPGTHLYAAQYFGAYNTNSGTAGGTECDAAYRGGNYPHTDGEGFRV